VNTDNSSGHNVAKGFVMPLPAPPGGGAAYGAHSLAVNVDATGDDYGFVTIGLDFCPGGAVANGIQGAFHALVWFKPGDATTVGGGPADVVVGGGSGTVAEKDTAWTTTGWSDVPSDYVGGVISVKHVDVTVAGIAQRKGTLYFDNMHFD
jgi:hypothetical protein